MTVGDVNSTERGSGARFNDGKPDFSLIPLDIVANAYLHPLYPNTFNKEVVNSLFYVGKFQVTGDALHLDAAIRELRVHWPDCARVFSYGAKKYASWNWAKGMAWSIPLACFARHALAEINGEYRDAESGEAHRGHMLCNLVMLRQYVTSFPEGDDLPSPELFKFRTVETTPLLAPVHL